MKKIFDINNEPEYRKEFFKTHPVLAELKEEFCNILFDKNGCNPNEIGKTILPKLRENFKRALDGKKLIPYTKEEKSFMDNKISKEWYISFATKLVNDERYRKYSVGIPVVRMNQKEDEESWLKYRKGLLPGYIKAASNSPSSAGPLIYPEESKFEGQSIVALKRDKQGLPYYGEKREIDEYIAKRGHEGEEYIYNNVERAMKYHLDIDVEMYPEPETMYEHSVLGDYLQGNMDGICQNLETMELEGVEIKTTGTNNAKQIVEYSMGIVPAGYLVQCSSYMAIRGFNAVNLIAGWGLGYKEGMAAMRILRNYEDEANLLGTLLWFSIEVVLKDVPVNDDIKYLNPEILLPDLYAIYGPEKTGKTVEKSDYKTIQATEAYIKALNDVDIIKQRHKNELKEAENKLKLNESILLEAAEDAERLVVEIEPGKKRDFFFRTKETSRFSSKLFDELLKKLQKGEVTDEEFDELVRDRRNFVNTISSRSCKFWKK